MMDVLLRACLTILLLCSALLAGCGGGSLPDTQHFVLARAPSQVLTAPASIPLASIQLPSYLRQAGIALMTAPHEISHARHHRWAEPLDEGIGRVLQAALESQLDTTHKVEDISVAIQHFHGDTDGNVLLAADWQIALSCDTILSDRFFNIERQSRDGYAAMVATQAALIERMSVVIAQSVASITACH